MPKKIETIGFFYRDNNLQAQIWKKKIVAWLKKNYVQIKIVERKPQILLVLGGDGTILEAARTCQNTNTTIFGLNLGHVGFLASARQPKKFFTALDKLFQGKYSTTKRIMMSASVMRNNKKIFSAYSLNDISIQNPLGVVQLQVSIEDHPLQYIHGTGVLVATATGSTAYNLSAHGPIVMPEIKCFVITELLDHNIPTPSIVVRRNKKISIYVKEFRKRGLLSITKTGSPIDVVLISDGETIFPLEISDTVVVHRSPRLIKFAEVEKHYFLKSLQAKFAFK